MKTINHNTWGETMPYPERHLKVLFKTSILLNRLGLGSLVGGCS
jgi:hypothetical protein